MDEKYILRGSTIEELAVEFRKTKLYSLCSEQCNELYIGIRNGYIDVYYRGCRIGKLYLSGKKLVCKITEKYMGNDKSGTTAAFSADEIADDFINIKTRIDDPDSHFGKHEKTAQQQLILNNNRNSSAEYYCIDMEYIEQRVSNELPVFGRFDIIAVSRQKPYKVALIELKYGAGAIPDGKKLRGRERSGVAKHANDYLKFLSEGRYDKHLKEEICLIVEAYRRFDVSGFPFSDGISVDELPARPDVYFLTVNANSDNKARLVMCHYIHLCKNCSVAYNAETRLGFDVSKPNKLLYVNFLFSENDGSGIYDIINGSAPDGVYVKGIE